MKTPNVVLVFADQWRAQATGYAGDPNVKTPHLDALAKESVNFTHAVAGCPVCSPYRASLLTGQFPLTHGVFVNDVHLEHKAVSPADAFASAGYDTAYIGKWHINGHGRSNYIPPEKRLGFDYWKVLECTHQYNHSAYYAGDSDVKLFWEGYDAIDQTHDAGNYIRQHAGSKPFFLVLSWGPPHNPYETAPPEYRALYKADNIILRPNVPDDIARQSRECLAGYYAHCSALDFCVGELLRAIRETGIENNTIFIFTSDHGDMLGSHHQERKQRPWDESVRVPFLLYAPGLRNWRPCGLDVLIDAPDVMPTILSLCGIPIPPSVEGRDYSACILGEPDKSDGAAVLMCLHPFGEWSRDRHDGREYRGLRTKRYTYVRTLDGPWLLYDNLIDPYQLRNLIADGKYLGIRQELDTLLKNKLARLSDDFLPGMDYIRKWGYPVGPNGTVPYTG